MRKVLLFVCLLMAGMTVNVNAAKQKAKHVILIGMDGWGAYSVPNPGYQKSDDQRMLHTS